MMSETQAAAMTKDAAEPEGFALLSNPLDWRTIDRLILLGALTMLAPCLFGVVLWLAGHRVPEFFRPGPLQALLSFYALHALCLSLFLVKAWKRRATVDYWPAFENFIIGSFVAVVMLSTWMVGTHYTQGLLLLFLGINITSALADIKKIRVAYLVVCALYAVLAIADFTGIAPYAPLFARLPVHADGSPMVGWLFAQVQLVIVLLAISAISMAAINRWVDRENLYREMSTIDGLTRLTNRRSFIERGHSELARAQRMGPSPVACVMVDLDHFKKINDTYGHHAGDQVLVAASAIMMESARQYDEVGRYGGEEFAILLPGASLDDAAHVAERIRARIASASVEVDGRVIPMTASFGVACYPANEIATLNDLLKAADKALYDAKESGRNRVCLARPLQVA
ncbi:MAG TPA: GGDEF domain-containing protein [Moraxellaceae bacterium]|nr:GGDEF domain-containing protein [Moraxellaceae bacterium]